MTNEQLNTALYKKMFAEQEKYRNWLLSQSPEEILNHSYEYNIREDILLSFENNDLSDAQARALLRSANPLADLSRNTITALQSTWITFGTPWNPVLMNCIKSVSISAMSGNGFLPV